MPAARNVISGNTYPNQSGGGVLLTRPGFVEEQDSRQLYRHEQIRNGRLAVIKLAYTWIYRPNNTIGGTTFGARNIISGNGTVGVGTSGAGGNLIEGNYIGTDATGTFSVANQIGVTITSDGFFNQIGDAVPGRAISFRATLFMASISTATRGKIHMSPRYSVISSVPTPPVPAHWQWPGRCQDTIWSLQQHYRHYRPGAANIIAFNGADPSQGGSGIHVVSDAGNGNLISGNSIYSNTTLGIDLDGQTSGVTNDDLDADDGPNGLQNYPVITNATIASPTEHKSAILFNSKPYTSYTVELFASDTCNASGTARANNLVSLPFQQTPMALLRVMAAVTSYLNKYITATATDPNGGTSEFQSACKSHRAVRNLVFQRYQLQCQREQRHRHHNCPAHRRQQQRGVGSLRNRRRWHRYRRVDYVAASGTLNWLQATTLTRLSPSPSPTTPSTSRTKPSA